MRMTNPKRGPILVAAATLGAVLFAAGGAWAAAKAAPVNTAEPTISGTPKVGQTLTASNGTWSNAPTSYEYQWLRCNTLGNSCVSVANGTQKTYTLVGADRGHTMRVRVTASNADGSAKADSQQTDVVAPAVAGAPRNTDRPIISGTPTVGETLTTDEGSWSGDPTSYSFRWQRCDADNIVDCGDVPGATSRSYLLRTNDIGYRMRVRVTARNASGSTTVNSATTAVIQPEQKITNQRPTLSILSVRFLGSTVYARFRVCDDSLKNVTILATDTRPGKASYTRRFTTLTAPRPCGVYTRHWTPVSRFRGAGRYTVVLKVRDKSGFTSPAAHRSFMRH
jgi:hypothetical protein